MVTKRTYKAASAPAPALGVADIHLCLDFINTEGVERNSPPDRLETSDLFFEWAARQSLVDARHAGALRKALRDSRANERFLARARELREALYRIFASLIDKASPARADLALLDRQLAEALPNLRLFRKADRFDWRLANPPSRPAELLWPIALSAADLLRSEQLDRVKECGGETCSWVFIDESRNRSRRWCDMSDCGNRAKARRFYHRQKGGHDT